MQSDKVFRKSTAQPFIMAGPCSAESEEQVLSTAHALNGKIDLYRAGLWKPRTRPNSFEGIGAVGLSWLKRVKAETGMRVTTEVAKASHVDLALEFGIDVLWIGARTTTNPFSVQEIADALKGVDIPVIIKNPINPDLKLWLGAVERIQGAGITRLAAIHRGFSFFNNKKYRNSPMWQIPIEFRAHLPELMMICDVSHICGSRNNLLEVAQQAMDLSYEGLMIEVHPDPDLALSDAAQQITPTTFQALIHDLVLRREDLLDSGHAQDIGIIRKHIDELDDHIIQLMGKRMELAEEIGLIKRDHDIPVLQSIRWNQILHEAYQKGKRYGLSEEFVDKLFKAIHQESINHQIEIMNQQSIPG